MPASVAQLLHRVMAIFRWMPVPHVNSRPRNGSALPAARGTRVGRCMLSPILRCRQAVDRRPLSLLYMDEKRRQHPWRLLLVKKAQTTRYGSPAPEWREVQKAHSASRLSASASACCASSVRKALLSSSAQIMHWRRHGRWRAQHSLKLPRQVRGCLWHWQSNLAALGTLQYALRMVPGLRSTGF